MVLDENVWSFFHSFQSASFVHSFLKKSYIQLQIPNAEVKSYENCYAFIYFIEHGKKYYLLTKHAPDEIKPILLFYGMIQLMKACLLTVDPNYPETTSVMAHGVSSRKRKKRNYTFLQDEVKIQKNGLLRHFVTHVLQHELTIERINMSSLLERIPEMNAMFLHHNKQKPSEKIEKTNDDKFKVAVSLLDHLHMTYKRFQDFLNANGSRKFLFYENKNNAIYFQIDNPFQPLDCIPFFYHVKEGYYIPLKRELYKPIHEIIVHYLLLYNLSIICRYETEWWNDLFHSFASDDLSFIRQFLLISETKTPHLLAQYLKLKKTKLT